MTAQGRSAREPSARPIALSLTAQALGRFLDESCRDRQRPDSSPRGRSPKA